MHFHLAHIVPAKALHGLNGYKEVIDTVEWGLMELGHTVSYGLNAFSTQGRNIIFGAQMLEPSVLRQLPPETIVYNFEQGRNVPTAELVRARPQMKLAAERFEVWDYSEANMPMWRSLGALRAEVVPIGYAPVLRRIPRSEPQDIDVLLYGMPGQQRVQVFHDLCHRGLTCLFVCGLYGAARDELVGRAKLVLNVNLYERSKIFEIVRVSYLLANSKAVVAAVDADTVIDPDMHAAVRIAPGRGVLDACMELVADRALRERQEQAGFEAMSRRDIRPILAEVID